MNIKIRKNDILSDWMAYYPIQHEKLAKLKPDMVLFSLCDVYKGEDDCLQEVSFELFNAIVLEEYKLTEKQRFEALRRRDGRTLEVLECKGHRALFDDRAGKRFLDIEDTSMVLDAMAQLTDTQRKRVYMRYFLDMKLDDIARIEGVSHQALTYSLNGALKKMKKFLE